MFRMTLYGHRLSNGGLTDSHLPLDVPGGSLDLGYLPRDPPGRYPTTRVNPPSRPTPNGQTDQLNAKAPASVTSKGCSNNLRPVSESIRRAETI